MTGKIDLDGRRLVAIGDVHGDFPAAMKALEIAGVMNSKGEWIQKHGGRASWRCHGPRRLGVSTTKFLRPKKKALEKEGGDGL